MKILVALFAFIAISAASYAQTPVTASVPVVCSVQWIAPSVVLSTTTAMPATTPIGTPVTGTYLATCTGLPGQPFSGQWSLANVLGTSMSFFGGVPAADSYTGSGTSSATVQCDAISWGSKSATLTYTLTWTL